MFRQPKSGSHGLDESSNVTPPSSLGFEPVSVLSADGSIVMADFQSKRLEQTAESMLSADNIILPAKAVDGLKPVQVTVMKETVFIVNNNTRLAGELLRSTAAALYDLKQNLVHRQWIAFLKSGVLPIPEKQARDLCAAWEGWLRDSDVTDGDLVNIGTRTLAKIKALEPNERKRVIKKIKSGDKVTEKDVTSTSTPSKPMSEAAMRKRLAELQAENASLKIENETLKKKVDELDLLVAQSY